MKERESMMIFLSFFSFFKKSKKLLWLKKKTLKTFLHFSWFFLPPFKLRFGDKDHGNVEQMCDFALYSFLGHTLVTFYVTPASPGSPKTLLGWLGAYRWLPHKQLLLPCQ